MLWKLHKAQPGRGTAWSVVGAWLGLRRTQPWTLAPWSTRQTGEVSGMLLASPSTSLMQAFPTLPGMRGAPAGGILAA